MLECVVNISEGRDSGRLAGFRAAAGGALLDVHADAGLNRSVFTLAGAPEDLHAAVCGLAVAAVRALDLAEQEGAHPRLGVLDVVPFVDLSDPSLPSTERSRAARDRFSDWAASTLGLPCFLYGPERSLPDVRRHAWRTLSPARGPAQPHPTAGAACVGARGALVAYNVLLGTDDLALAREIAGQVRGPGLRTLAFPAGGAVEVSCNLTDPYRRGPAEAYDAVVAAARRLGPATVTGAELVGLLPDAVLRDVPPGRWEELGIGPARTIEAALARPRSW